MGQEPHAEVFRYDGWSIDGNRVTGHYRLGQYHFAETWEFESGDFAAETTHHAVRYLYLLAGVSYYKTHAPLTIDLGETELLPLDRELLLAYYHHGLGEFRVRNHLDLSGLRLIGGLDRAAAPAATTAMGQRPLVCFGGGMDSLVSTELLRPTADVTLFVVSKAADRFQAIEGSLERSGLPVARATRILDGQVLRSAELGFHNGHVPVTGIVSALALVTACLGGHDAVVMSNERSSSAPTQGEVNHQWSKSWAFEKLLAEALAQVPGMPQYFSLLRPWSELWIARQFVELCQEYFTSFCSCNRAFLTDPARRSVGWCSQCDKCAFLDLILAPYLSPEQLAEVFTRGEPLRNADLLSQFKGLVTSGHKPWECVGDEAESRNAVRLAAARPDRQGPSDRPLAELHHSIDGLAAPPADELLRPQPPHSIPERYASAARLH
ncbi:MAG: hypothetical protein ACK5KO_13690 [Arachnia sp.]